VGPMAVVPIGLESQFALEGRAPIGNEKQSPRALGLNGSDGPLYYRQTPVFPQSPEAKLNPPPSAPAPESP
jgi:hypothetical protein